MRKPNFEGEVRDEFERCVLSSTVQQSRRVTVRISCVPCQVNDEKSAVNAPRARINHQMEAQWEWQSLFLPDPL